MILISLQPFALKKVFAFLAVVLGFSTASCFAASLFLSVESTPYDRQMSRVRPIITASRGAQAHDVSMTLVNHWMEDLRGIPYGFHMEWKTPEEVESGQSADCKGKAVALYQKMKENGAKNVRLVIGRRAPTSKVTHAWLVWETEQGDYVLDPTFNWMARRADEIGDRSYVPLYAFAGNRKYKAEGARGLYANN